MPAQRDPYEQAPHCRPTRGPAPQVGETVYVQQSYDLVPGKVVKLNRTTATVHFEQFGYLPHDRKVPYEKLALGNEPIACICEYWRGVNGAGGYRIDRHLHAAHFLPASQLPRQGYLCENQPGVLGPGETVQKLAIKRQSDAAFAAAVLPLLGK